MKKIFIASLALAAVAACNKAEVIDMAPQKAISFADPFVDASTKSVDPSYNADNMFESFFVYGTVKNTAVEDVNKQATVNIFAGIPVTSSTANSSTTWSYEDTYNQYWFEGNTYDFAAVVASSTVETGDFGMPKSLVYTSSTQEDILYAKIPAPIKSDGNDSPVSFTFNHLLSKVKFNFKSTYTVSEFTVKVTNIKILNSYATGTVSFPNTWGNQEGKQELKFGNADYNPLENSTVVDPKIPNSKTYASTYERLLIPGNAQTLKITFDVEVYMGDFLVDTYSYVENQPATVTVDLKPGYSYNFNAEIGKTLNLITFNVETVNGFTPNTPDQNVTLQ